MGSDAREPSCAPAHAALVERGMLRAVSRDDRETQAWLDHDIASYAEHRLGIALEPPLRLRPDALTDLLRRATEDGRVWNPHNGFSVPYWLLEAKQPVGSVALGVQPWNGQYLRLSSLHVQRAHRGRGVARELLRAVQQASLDAGLAGLLLDTSWAWQPAVRLYLSVGMWVQHWKREPQFMFHRRLPLWSLALDGDEARFELRERAQDAPATAIVARRRGTRLEWTQSGLKRWGHDVEAFAPGTFALALAVRGWPLITSDEAWKAQLQWGYSDGGGPDALAYNIRHWEAWHRHRGWRVETPRIGGLTYVSWEQLGRERGR